MFKNDVFAVAYSITSDYQLAEDCVAETFIRLTQVKNFNSAKGDGKGTYTKQQEMSPLKSKEVTIKILTMCM